MNNLFCKIRTLLGVVTALSTTLFVLAPSAANAQLSVTGADSAQIKLLNTWYDQHISACFRGHDRMAVRELNDREMDAYLRSGNPDDNSAFRSTEGEGDLSDIDGVFENDPPRMALRIPDNGSIDLFTFAHEYGHYVWFDIMKKSDRDQYKGVYDRQKKKNQLVTRYAATDLEEGFAEAFSFYVNQPELLNRRDPASYQFFLHWSGADHTAKDAA